MSKTIRRNSKNELIANTPEGVKQEKDGQEEDQWKKKVGYNFRSARRRKTSFEKVIEFNLF